MGDHIQIESQIKIVELKFYILNHMTTFYYNHVLRLIIQLVL